MTPERTWTTRFTPEFCADRLTHNSASFKIIFAIVMVLQLSRLFLNPTPFQQNICLAIFPPSGKALVRTTARIILPRGFTRSLAPKKSLIIVGVILSGEEEFFSSALQFATKLSEISRTSSFSEKGSAQVTGLKPPGGTEEFSFLHLDDSLKAQPQ